MKDYIIIADSACDLPQDIIDKYSIEYIGLSCNFKNKEYIEDCGSSLSYSNFYNGIRDGETPSTSQINSYTFYNKFEDYVKTNISILYLSFSSALSGTYNSSLIAKEDIISKFPTADITIIDTKSASLGYGLLVIEACKMKGKGCSKDKVAEHINNIYPKLNHIVTLDDLDFLRRGGRLSGTAATLGTILQLKPMVKMNDLGQLINYGKVKGRKKAIHTLFKEFENRVVNIESQDLIAICHSDCLDDAEKLATMIKAKYDVEILINYIGCVIGSHTGANTLAIFFLGSSR